jgi:hypothetical protein
MNAVANRQVKYKKPTLEVLERILYIVIRAEMNVLTEMILPTNVPENHFLYVRWAKDSRLFYGFIPYKEVSSSERIVVTNKLIDQCIENREWYFDWKGDGLGPFMLPHQTVYTLARQRAGRCLTLHGMLHEGDPSMSLLSFANKYLYAFS